MCSKERKMGSPTLHHLAWVSTDSLNDRHVLHGQSTDHRYLAFEPAGKRFWNPIGPGMEFVHRIQGDLSTSCGCWVMSTQCQNIDMQAHPVTRIGVVPCQHHNEIVSLKYLQSGYLLRAACWGHPIMGKVPARIEIRSSWFKILGLDCLGEASSTTGLVGWHQIGMVHPAAT